ncbi:MAG TPA: SBBP repeat-containing protein [Bacteroidia bacterium]
MRKKISFEVDNYNSMKKNILYLLFAVFLVQGLNAQVNIRWQNRYTSAGSFVDKAEDIVTDAVGNSYVTGIGRGTSGTNDYITIKYNNAGVQQWVAQYNGTGSGLDAAHAIAVDTFGNVYVTGWSDGGATTGYDYATIKYNASGVQQWVARYNNSTNGTDEAWDVAVDYAGNVYVTGTSDGTGTNSAATTVKYNSAGAQLYAQRYNGAGGDIDAGYAIYVDRATGVAYVTGYTFQSAAADFDFITLKYNAAGTQQWATRYNGPGNNYDEARSIAVDAAGNVYVTGYTQTTVLTNYDYATVKYNSAGVQQWAQNYNGTGNDFDRANAIRLDAANNIYVTGRSIGASPAAEDIVTIKYNNAGTQKWLARYGAGSNVYDEGKALVVDGTGNVYVTGYSNNDYATIKYDSTGVQQWLTKYNGTGNNVDQAVGIAIDNIGDVWVSGKSKGPTSNEDFQTIKYCQLTANAGTDTTICNGQNTTLSASAPGAVSYAWLPNNGTLSSTTSATPVASPAVTTLYTVAITNVNGCVDLDTVIVNVDQLPSSAITPASSPVFCIGDSVILNAAAGADQYQWSSSVNDTLPSIMVNTSGTYTVTVTDTNGCSSTSSQLVTVNPLPVVDAGNDTTVCHGQTVSLMANGAATYVWSPGMTLNDSTVSNPQAMPDSTLTYYIVGTSAAGCVNSDSLMLTVLPTPAVPVITWMADTLTSTAGTSYQWYDGGVPIAGATNQFYVFTNNGNYSVEVFNASGCSATSAVTNVTNVGLSEMDLAGILNVYPNPVSDKLTFELANVKGDIKISLMNVSGQLIFSEAADQSAGTYRKSVDLSGYPAGIYYLQIITQENVITKKIIRE